jgi:hypothetical protein
MRIINKNNVFRSFFRPGNHISAIFGVYFWRNKSWKPESVMSFNMGWRILVFYPEPESRDKIY